MSPHRVQMNVRGNRPAMPVVAGAAYVVEPMQEAIVREFVQDTIDALARHGRQGLLDGPPDCVHVRMSEILANKRKDSQPLGRAFPAARPANLPKLLVYCRVHLTINTYLASVCK